MRCYEFKWKNYHIDCRENSVNFSYGRITYFNTIYRYIKLWYNISGKIKLFKHFVMYLQRCVDVKGMTNSTS